MTEVNNVSTTEVKPTTITATTTTTTVSLCDTPTTTTTSKSSPPPQPTLKKLCRVCGDRAIAFNFNGLTCESCKSFFRRNANKINKLNCTKNNVCSIELTNRNSCKRCRLQKCLDIGMRKEMVLEKRNNKVKCTGGETGVAASATCKVSANVVTLECSEKSSVQPTSQERETLDETDEEEKLLRTILTNLRDHQTSPSITTTTTTTTTILSSSALHSGVSTTQGQTNDGDKEETVRNRKSCLHHNYLDTVDHQEVTLNSLEQSLVDEVNHATESTFVEELCVESTGDEIGSFADGLNWFAVYVRKVIRFCKCLAAFRPLDQDDQLAIIKPYFTEMLLVRFTFAYSETEDAFPLLVSETSERTIWLRIKRLREANLDEFYLRYRQFIMVTQVEMENDTTLRNLLTALLMFRGRPELSCPEYVRYHYVIYVRLLARYLEHKYRDVQRAADKFRRLLRLVEEICAFREPITELYTLVERDQIKGVLGEIYELKLRFDRLSLQ